MKPSPRPRSTRSARRWVAAWAAGLGLWTAAATAAEPPPRVAIVSAAPDSGAAIRIERELRNLGVEVVQVSSDDSTAGSRGALEESARSVGAFAAIRVVTAGDAAEVWVADRVTGKTVIREVVRVEGSADDGEVALGAVELLRASLLELQVPERIVLGEVPPTAAIEGLVPEPTAPALETHTDSLPAATTAPDALAIGLGALASPGLRGAGPLFGAVAGLAARVGASPWGVAATLIAAQGDLDIAEAPSPSGAHATLAWVGLAPSWGPAGDRFTPRIALGLAAARLDLRGTTRGALRTRHERAWLAAPYLAVGGGVALSPRLRARADAWLIAALNQAEIRFADQEVATFGRPELFAAASLEVVVP